MTAAAVTCGASSFYFFRRSYSLPLRTLQLQLYWNKSFPWNGPQNVTLSVRHTALVGANTKRCSQTVPTLQHNTNCVTKSPTVSIERSRTQYRCLYKALPCLPLTESVYFVVAVHAVMARRIHLSCWSAIWMDQQLLLQVCQQLSTWRCELSGSSSHHCPFSSEEVLYCIALYCIVLYCIVLYWTVLYCIVLYCSLWRLSTRDFKLPPRCRSYLRSSEMLHNICWQLATHLSGRHIDPLLKCGAAQGHRLKPLLRDVPVQRRPQCCQLPRLSNGWCLKECMWSIGGMTLTGDNTSTREILVPVPICPP